jgi:hypothetical protein
VNKIYCLVIAAFALAVIAATPPASRIGGSPFNPPQFPVVPEFCSVIKQSIDGDTGGVAAGNTDFVMHFAQRFTPSSNYTVCRIDLKCGFLGTPGTNAVLVSLYSHNSAGDGEPNAPIASCPVKASINLPSVSAPLTNDVNVPWTRFDIPPTSLVSGTTYWVVCYEAKASIFTGNYFVWYNEGGAISVNNNSMNCNVNVFPATIWNTYNNNTRFKFLLKGQEPL